VEERKGLEEAFWDHLFYEEGITWQRKRKKGTSRGEMKVMGGKLGLLHHRKEGK